VAKFHFAHSKLRKRPFFAKMLIRKFQILGGTMTPLPHNSDAHVQRVRSIVRRVDFSIIWWSSITKASLLRGMKYNLQHCCDKTMDDKKALHRECSSELYKPMVNKATFVGCRGSDRPPPGSSPQGSPTKCGNAPGKLVIFNSTSIHIC